MPNIEQVQTTVCCFAYLEVRLFQTRTDWCTTDIHGLHIHHTEIRFIKILTVSEICILLNIGLEEDLKTGWKGWGTWEKYRLCLVDKNDFDIVINCHEMQEYGEQSLNRSCQLLMRKAYQKFKARVGRELGTFSCKVRCTWKNLSRKTALWLEGESALLSIGVRRESWVGKHLW